EAMRRAHGRLSAEEFAEIRRMIDEMERIALDGDHVAAYAVFRQLHFRIYQATGSRLLLRILDIIWDELARIHYNLKPFTRTRKHVQRWVSDQRKLIDVLEKGTADAVAEQMAT